MSWWPVALIFALLGSLGLSASLAMCLLPKERGRDWWLAACTLGAAALTLGLRLWGGAGWLSRGPVLGGLAATNVCAGLLAVIRRARLPLRPPALALRSALSLPTAIGAAAIAIATLSAWALPIWQWDALGYHLPFVNFTLQSHSLAGVPQDVPYLSTYPHNIELAFLGARLFLPDDRLLDLGQLPFGILGAFAIFGIARRLGSERGLALAAGSLWLAMPAVFLQLPTNYVDVASASYFLLATYWIIGLLTRERILLAGLALGLFLGSKPSAVMPSALLTLLLVFRCVRGRLWWPLLPGGLLGAALGVEAYITNWLRHGNPVWPVIFKVGPWQLPGTETIADVLTTGSAVPHLADHAWWRLFQSWVTPAPWPIFDMRIGGFGLAFLVAALPGAVWALRERRLWLMFVPLLAALASPDPAIARYTLPFPALCLALAARSGTSLTERWRTRAVLATAGVSLLSFVIALPGLTGSWPTLLSCLGRPADEVFEWLGPERPPTGWLTLRRSTDGCVIAYDKSLELPYLLWRGDLSNTVVRIPDGLSEPALRDWLRERHVTSVAAGNAEPAGALVRSHPEEFHRLFGCESGLCEIYRVNGDQAACQPELSGAF